MTLLLSLLPLLPLLLLPSPSISQPEPDAPWPQFSSHSRYGWRSAPLSSICTSRTGGNLIASALLPGQTDSSPAVSRDGVVYISTRDGGLVALDSLSANFTTLWTFQNPAYIFCSSPAAIDVSGLVFTGCGDNTLYALFASNGTVAWTYRMAGTVNAPVAIGADGTLFVGSLGGDFIAFEAATGAAKWQRALSSVWYSAAIGSNGVVYVADSNLGLLALDQATGSTLWQNAIQNESAFASPAIAPNGYVVWGTHEGTVVASDPLTGLTKWTLRTGSDMTSFAVTPLGLVVFGDVGGAVRGVDSRTGTGVWLTFVGDEVQSAPALGADGTVYVGSNSGKLYALCGWTGKAKWAFQTDSPITSCAPAIGKHGEVYVASSGGTLYSLSCGRGKREEEEEEGADGVDLI